jgi:hypothetical protein
MKVRNIDKFINSHNQNFNFPNLEFFINRVEKSNSKQNPKQKFDYQTTIKCKFCALDYSAEQLKYKLTPKMIFETVAMLKHIGHEITYIDRPDLKNANNSMMYLPYRVCKKCFLLFETTNDIKNYQIEIANYFRIPVDPVNFSKDIEKKPNQQNKEPDEFYIDNNRSVAIQSIKEETPMIRGGDDSESSFNEDDNNMPIGSNTVMNTYQSGNNQFGIHRCLYRILICFNDIFWKEDLKVPLEKELFLVFNFIGKWYKVKIKQYYEQLDYFNVNFFKIFHIICNETTGFINYVEKNKNMTVQLGYFEIDEMKEKHKEVAKTLKKNIVIEDEDVCNKDDFIEIASVELSLQGLKYGQKYENKLNGLLFRKEAPHYVGRLRCVIRINKEQTIDITKYQLTKHFNVNYGFILVLYSAGKLCHFTGASFTLA